MVSMPAETPVTNPPAIVAEVLLPLHMPPIVASVSKIEAPMHTFDGPDIVSVTDEEPTVILFVAVLMPHALVTV